MIGKKLSPINKVKFILRSPLKNNNNSQLNSSGINSLKNINSLCKINSFTENNKNEDLFKLKRNINQKIYLYSLSQLKKDFKQSRIYKKISCEYPSINFIKKRKKNSLPKNLSIGLTPKSDSKNSLNDIKFKPFTFFIEDESKKSNNNSSNKKNRNSNANQRNQKLFMRHGRTLIDMKSKTTKDITNMYQNKIK